MDDSVPEKIQKKKDWKSMSSMQELERHARIFHRARCFRSGKGPKVRKAKG